MVARFEQVAPEKLAEFTQKPSMAYENALGSDFDDVLNHPQAREILTKMVEQFDDISQRKGLPKHRQEQMKKMRDQIAARIDLCKPSQDVASAPTRAKTFSLEKDWHVLHYALTGSADPLESPLSASILGGSELPDAQGVMGYGPLRYLDPIEVQSSSNALNQVNPDQLLSRLNKEDAERKKIYLAHTLGDIDDWTYLPALFEDFRRFYADAATKGVGLILSIV